MVRARPWTLTPVRLVLIVDLSLVMLPLGVTGQQATAHATASGTRPMLVEAASPNPNPRVLGKGWPSQTRLTVAVRFYGLQATTRFRTTRAGTFGVALRGVHWCRRLMVTARDAAGHQVALQGTGSSSLCTAPPSGATIVIHVLSAKQMRFMQIVVDSSQPQSQYTPHVADILLLYEPETQAPAILPIPDPAHLELVDQGPLPSSPAAPGWPAGPGFYWRYRATHAGDTILTISHQCRQTHPPCMLPDRAIRIQILP